MRSDVSYILQFVDSTYMYISSLHSTFSLQTNVSHSNNLSQRVEPHSDYFTASFLLSFPAPGTHKVHITADVVDESETLWKTGPHATIAVKSYDDTIHKKASKPVSRNSFGQMPSQT